MKEEELDKYVGKFVKITDFENETIYGTLYKVKDGVCLIGKLKELCAISNGYLLRGRINIVYRKSHIKKIEEREMFNYDKTLF